MEELSSGPVLLVHLMGLDPDAVLGLQILLGLGAILLIGALVVTILNLESNKGTAK